MIADKLDEKIRHDLVQELGFLAKVDPGSVNIAVESSVVRLTGHVDDLATRQAIEQLARLQPGVLSVANEIQVRHHSHDIADDARLARAVVEAFGSKSRPLS